MRSNHLKEGRIRWPDPNKKGKPNALVVDAGSEKLLLPNGPYVVVKRLTSKEEAKRVRAAVSDPSSTPGQWVAFENHLNVFHRANRGLPDGLAQGLATYLNSSFVDRYVRQFNGHTQVNATDLRQLRYPRAEQLLELGAAAMRHGASITQTEVDDLLTALLADPATTLLQSAA